MRRPNARVLYASKVLYRMRAPSQKKTVKRKRIPELHRVVVKRNFVCAEEKDTQK